VGHYQAKESTVFTVYFHQKVKEKWLWEYPTSSQKAANPSQRQQSAND
jgi:hypothetical protein